MNEWERKVGESLSFRKEKTLETLYNEVDLEREEIKRGLWDLSDRGMIRREMGFKYSLADNRETREKFGDD